jgi:hypothetical protein
MSGTSGGVPMPRRGQIIDDQSSSAAGAAAVSLASDTDYTEPVVPVALYVGGAGNVKVDMLCGGTGVTFPSVPAGTTLPVAVTKIYSTSNGTTASNLVAMFRGGPT